MRVCIVGLDALEYELVHEFYCENLKQRQCGKIDLAEFKQQSPTGEPLTPIIWSSFITGLEPNQTGITVKRYYSNPIMDKVRTLIFKCGLADTIVDMISIQKKQWIRDKILAPCGLSSTLVGVEEAWKIEKEYYQKRQLKTIFDLSKNPVIIDMPTYTPAQGRGDKSWRIAKSFLYKKISRAEFIRKEIDLLDEEINYAFTLLNKPWDLFVFYTKIIDSVGHFLAWDTKTMWHLYERVDNFVKELGRSVGSDTFILVISDHGMKRTGIHSDHAFYSTNVRLNLKNPKITDFYNIIAEIISRQ